MQWIVCERAAETICLACLERGAHADEVRPGAYIAISKAVHPDKNPGRMAEAGRRPRRRSRLSAMRT